MTKRKVIAMIIALALCIPLCACSAESESSKIDNQPKSVTFIVVVEGSTGAYSDQTIMYDPDTRVMYTYLDGYHSGTMSVLYNADGTLKLYSSNKKYDTFIVVTEGSAGYYSDQTIMYDPDTRVMYTYLDGTMSVLYNADGTLKLYSPKTKYDTFIAVVEGSTGSYSDQEIMYDPDTLVMYTYLDGYQSGIMSVLYNADGTPKLYSFE